jgi:glycosyltransferase involved in cell wall biosynthesis
VANPPDKMLEEKLAAWQEVRYLASDRLGANHARNLGLNHARGGVVLFLDDDCFVHHPSFLRDHVRAHERRPDATAVGGPYSCPIQAGRLARAYHAQQMKWLHEGLRPGYHSDLLVGGNLSLKRKALNGLLFESALVFGGTETEFLFRLTASGHKSVFDDLLTVEHRAKIGFWLFFKKAFLQGKGTAFLEGKGFFGVPLVIRKSGKGHSRGGVSGIDRLIGRGYELFFQAGYRSGLKNSSTRNSTFFILYFGMREVMRDFHSTWNAYLDRYMVIFRCALLLRKR